MNAQRMSIVAMQSNARFLTDRMAYTLGIRDPYLIDEIYRINYDYIWGVNEYLDDVALGYYYDDYMTVVAARDAALRNLLGYTVWNRLIGYTYFHRPIVFVNRGWHFSIYDYDRYGINRFYYHAPRPIAHGYAGGHFFRPMAPRSVRRGAPAPVAVPRREAHVSTPRREVHYNRQNGLRAENHSEARPENHADNHRQNFGGNSNMNSGSNSSVSRPNQAERTNSNVGTSRNGANSHMRSNGNANSSSRQYTPRSASTPSTPSLTNASMTTRSSAASSVNRGNARVSSQSRMAGGSTRGGSHEGGSRRGGRR